MATAARRSPLIDSQYDELDKKIDGFLGKAGAIFRFLLVIGMIAAFFYFIYIPNLETAVGITLTVLQFMFQIFFAILFMIIQFVALFWFLGRTRVYWMMPGETGVGFKDYKGNPEILELADRVVTLLRGVKGFKEMGGQVHRGMLLAGPPGTGKSYLAQCIASEAGVPFCYASAPSFQNMFMGIGNLRVMMLYSKARKMARKFGACIIFIDEIDAIGASRGGQQQGGMMGPMMGFGGSGLLNELLMQMDPPPTDSGWKNRLLRKFGLRTKKAEIPAVFTMGATNLIQVLDAALLRPGRFDWKVTVERPSLEGRKEVLDYYLDKVAHDPKLPRDRIATEMITPEGLGYSPVEIKFVVNEACVHAHFDGREQITYEDVRHAMETREYGLRQKISGRSAEDKRRVAYHEAGHAIAMIRLYTRKRLDRLTLMMYGELRGAEGVAFDKAKEEIHIQTKEEILVDMQTYLGGKAAEIVFLGTETPGVGSDLQNATRLAVMLVGYSGMDGTLFSDAYNPGGPVSGETRRSAERLLQQQFKLVKNLVEDNQPHVHAIVEKLLEKEELLGEEVEEIVARVDKELGRSSGKVVDLPVEPPRPAAEPEPVVRYAGATRRAEDRPASAAGPSTSAQATVDPPEDRPPAS